MKRYQHYRDFPPPEDKKGCWVKYEDAMKVINKLKKEISVMKERLLK